MHRFGDVSSSWIFGCLKSLGMSLVAMSWLAVPIAGAWLAVALWLGGQQSSRVRHGTSPSRA